MERCRVLEHVNLSVSVENILKVIAIEPFFGQSQIQHISPRQAKKCHVLKAP